jgi:hypothetical protein
MKAYFKDFFRGYSGKSDDCIFYYHSKCQVCLVRSKSEFKPNATTNKMKSIMANLKLLNPSQAYKQDLVDYLYCYNALKENRDRQLINWSNLYLKLLFKMAKLDSEVNLLTLTRAQIFAEALPCKSVKAAIGAGLLPVVDGYERFDNEL